MHKQTLQICAIKLIDIGRLIQNMPMLTEYIEREVAVLKKLSHPNIVGLTEHIEDKKTGQHILAMEYCAGPTLDRYLRNKKLTERAIRDLFVQLVEGLKYMWSRNIIHRDIKPQNILFTSDSDDAQLKLIDFGFSQIRNPNSMMTSVVGTPLYMAPEILKSTPYTNKCDLWSVGCILYEIIVGHSPFVRAANQADLMKMQDNWNLSSLPQSIHVSHMCLDLLKRLLQADPVSRMDWPEFFMHPFVKNPETLQESYLNVHIEPKCRSVILHTHDLDPSCKVSVMKAHLLSNNDCANAEKYDGVAAILETKKGERIEMLDHLPVSEYKDQLMNGSKLFLVLPLNISDETPINDTAYEVLFSVIQKYIKDTSPTSTLSTFSSSSTTSTSSTLSSSSTTSNNSQIDDTTSLQIEFIGLSDDLKERVRASREVFETCRVYLECREIQTSALKSSMIILEKHRNQLKNLIVSFKEMYKQPMEQDLKSLPALVEKHIEELRKTSAAEASGLPTLKGKTLLDCVGEREIRETLLACKETISASGSIVDSCDAAINTSNVGPEAMNMIEMELEYNKRDIEMMRDKLEIVENAQHLVEFWVNKIQDQLNQSWLGFESSFTEPLLIALNESRSAAVKARAAADGLRNLSEVIVDRKEIWPVMVSQFREVANARTHIFGAFRSLHVCGGRSYEPQKHTIYNLQNLTEIIRKIAEEASGVYQERLKYEDKAQVSARRTDDDVQGFRTGVLQLVHKYHNKYEKNPYAKGFVTALDALKPPAVRVSVHSPDLVIAQAALAESNARNAKLMEDFAARERELVDRLQGKEREVSSLQERTRALERDLSESRTNEWQMNTRLQNLSLGPPANNNNNNRSFNPFGNRR